MTRTSARSTAANGCLLCGAPLRYAEQASTHTCALCGATAQSEAACTAGHYVCDRCHECGALDLIERTCCATAETHPIRLAASLMAQPQIHMHGPEHHFLVPAVLLTTFLNVAGRAQEKPKLLAQARRRADQVPGGFCGFHGTCGAGIGVGIFVSVATGATPLSTSAWRLANASTARALARIAANGGPRCCKRDTFHALLEAVEIVREALQVALPLEGAVRCTFHDQNRECLREQCAFFPSAAQ